MFWDRGENAVIYRYLAKPVISDLKKKMVFIAGPRQSGKTTLARHLADTHQGTLKTNYLNWDSGEDRNHILKENFPSGNGILVLDEIHKYRYWRQTVKGLFDKRKEELQILVTGSGKLDYYSHGGDSLQGRYYFYRLHPLTLGELKGNPSNELADLLCYGGFPGPFVEKSERETRRWTREYNKRIIDEDLRSLENVRDFSLISLLVSRLPDLVGSPLSVNSLCEDLQVAHQTVKRWLVMLENIYLIFRLYPFGASAIRAVKKEAKHYHFNWTEIEDEAIRFENLVACHLLKWVHFQQDFEGLNYELRYFRDVDRREVDFVLCRDGKPESFIECKTRYKETSRSLLYLRNKFPRARAHQVIYRGEEDFFDKNGVHVVPAAVYLKSLI